MSNMWVVGFGAGAGFGAGDTLEERGGTFLEKTILYFIVYIIVLCGRCGGWNIVVL